MARVKPHAKIHVSVAHHPKTQDIWADPAQRGMLVEIWRLAMERYAGKRGDILSLRPLDRLSIAGELEQSRADLLVSVLLRTLKYRLRKHPNRWDVHIRNFADKHGFSHEESTPIHVPDSNKNGTHKKEERREKKEERREKREEQTASRLSRKSPSSPCPQSLGPEEQARLASWASQQVSPIESDRLIPAWEIFKSWAHGGDHRRVDWEATFRNALSKGWCLKANTPHDESPAQARQRRTREAATGALEILKRNREQGPLELHVGGKP